MGNAEKNVANKEKENISTPRGVQFAKKKERSEEKGEGRLRGSIKSAPWRRGD